MQRRLGIKQLVGSRRGGACTNEQTAVTVTSLASLFFERTLMGLQGANREQIPGQNHPLKHINAVYSVYTNQTG